MDSITKNTLLKFLDDAAKTLLIGNTQHPRCRKELATHFKAVCDTADAHGFDDLAREAQSAIAFLHGVSESSTDDDEVHEALSDTISRLQLICYQHHPHRTSTKSFSITSAARSDTGTARGNSLQNKTPPSENLLHDQDSFAHLTVDKDLVSDFIAEVQEHLDAADDLMLELEKGSGGSETLSALFRAFHTIKGAAGFLSLSEMTDIAHATESLLDRMRKGSVSLERGTCFDLMGAGMKAMRQTVSQIAYAARQGSSTYRLPASVKKAVSSFNDFFISLSSTVVSDAASGAQQLRDLPEPSAPVRSADDAITTPHMTSKPADSPVEKKTSGPRYHQSENLTEYIRVEAVRLDYLSDTVGELLTVQSMIERQLAATGLRLPELESSSYRLAAVSKQLQHLSTSFRMIPLRGTCKKIHRLVRDLSRKKGKQVECLFSGEETLLDKYIVEKLQDPLVHIVRNCVDHGIESSGADRIEAGKPRSGCLSFSASHTGGDIEITIADDGAGIDVRSLLDKARAAGILSHDSDAPTDEHAVRLIFTPGISTTDIVSDTSGRGIGMDIVKKTVESLHGSIHVSSQIGQGTTFTIRVPLTLAIIDGMIVRAGNERYCVPVLSIAESLRPTGTMIKQSHNGYEKILFRNTLLPLLRLHSLFDIPGAIDDPYRGVVLILDTSGGRAALLVDSLEGRQSTVIKSLPSIIGHIVGIAGTAVMPDGQIGFIVDVPGLVPGNRTQDRPLN